MTPSEENELRKQLADAKGRIAAVELRSREIEREAKILTTQAEALKAETDASLATAAEQMKVAHAVGCAIFGMTELSRAFMARKIAAARCAHRENGLADRLSQIISAVEKGDQATLKTLSESGKSVVATIKADGEANRNKFQEHFLALGFGNFDQVFDQLIKE